MDRSRDSGTEPVTIGKGECVLDRPTAILVAMLDAHGSPVDRWIPKSVVHDDSEVYRAGTAGKVVVRAWWAREHGIVEAELPSAPLHIERRSPLPMKPPTKKWLKEQVARMKRASR
jgi:hypothetical protein